MFKMRRREFIGLLGGAAAAWPLAARAQQPPSRAPLVAVLLALAEDDPDTQRRIQAFRRGLEETGWQVGQNIRVEYRFAAAKPDLIAEHAAELVAARPNVIVGNSTPVVAALQRATRDIPVVFVQIIDPVGSGLVESLARPGGNMTGFSDLEFSFSSKWLELLREVAPRASRAVVLFAPGLPSNAGLLRALEETAPAMGVQLKPVAVREAADIERGLAGLAMDANAGLIVMPSPLTGVHRNVIIRLAAHHALRAVYPFRYFALSGGLLSYGVDNAELYRRGASYVDRILKGTPAADLPVQQPTKYELVINLTTAKALGLEIPPTLLARADEVIE